MKRPDGKKQNNKIARTVPLLPHFWVLLAIIFYIFSILMMSIKYFENKMAPAEEDILRLVYSNESPEFRQAIDAAARLFEKIKKQEGCPLKIEQKVIAPVAYEEWLQSRMYGKTLPDILMLEGDRSMINKYFVPLGPYLARPNPFNVGTSLSETPWISTFMDGLRRCFDPLYGEYFGVEIGFRNIVLYVNEDMLLKTTGKTALPENFSEWLDDCGKITAYSERQRKIIVPIAIAGKNDNTLSDLFRLYYSQLNGGLGLTLSKFCVPTLTRGEIISGLKSGRIDKNRLSGGVDIVNQLIGRAGGFATLDGSQAMMLFLSGRAVFFVAGSAHADYIAKNCSFNHAVIKIPAIGSRCQYSIYCDGNRYDNPSVTCRFGISRNSRHFEQSLAFLQFLTSREVNQMLAVRSFQLPAISQARRSEKNLAAFAGTESFIPPPGMILTADYPEIICNGGFLSETGVLSALKTQVWNEFIKRRPLLLNMLQDDIIRYNQNFMEQEKQRSRWGMEMLKNNGAGEKQWKKHDAMLFERVIEEQKEYDDTKRMMAVLNEVKD